MDFKKLLLVMGLSLLTVLLIQKLFFKSDVGNAPAGAIKAGQSFMAPQSLQEAKPLNREIDFIDEKKRAPEQLTEVVTGIAKYTFSNEGASLERIEIKRMLHGKEHLMSTVFPAGPNERKNKCFLLALNEKTPYFYDLLGVQETNSSITVRYGYSAPTSDVQILKAYTIFKETYKIDLKIEVIPTKQGTEAFEPRLFFPSPFTPEIPGAPCTVAMNERGKVERILGDKVNVNRGWLSPLMFGADSKYFVNTMIEDSNKFTQRAYYRDAAADKLVAILEGPAVTQATTWNLSFYFGPKEEVAMAKVDDRLEQTLEYSGWLSPVAKVILWILKFFHKYIPNYGVAILLISLLIRLLLLPFTIRAEGDTKKRAELQKKLQYVEQKYKGDKEALAQAKAELIRKNGMPGLGGCLPLLLQLPIFFALSRVLSSSIELYQAPFFGWITDLSAKDPYYILPILLALTMLVQGLTGDKSQRFTFMAMALVVAAMMVNLAAGLVLYIVVSTMLGLLQTFIQKKLKAA
jgi:YidC/Oxa1 family membrane protein insertase